MKKSLILITMLMAATACERSSTPVAQSHRPVETVATASSAGRASYATTNAYTVATVPDSVWLDGQTPAAFTAHLKQERGLHDRRLQVVADPAGTTKVIAYEGHADTLWATDRTFCKLGSSKAAGAGDGHLMTTRASMYTPGDEVTCNWQTFKP